MAGPSGRSKRKDSKADQYKEVCPPHKLKDLDALVKSLKGNEVEIMAKIQEWWEEPPTEEPEWADVNRKAVKKKTPPQGRGGGGGRSGTGRGGRGFQGSRAAGRGAGPERRSGRSREREKRPAPQAKSPQPADEQKPATEAPSPPTGPVPVTSAPAPKGAWGLRGAPGGVQAATAPPPAVPLVTPSPEKQQVTPVKPPEIPEKPADIGMAAPEDPTPSGMRSAGTPERPVRPPPAASTGGNVWATKGSAHLIQAEKPKPPPPPPQMRSAPSEPAPKSRNRRDVKQSLEPKGISPPEPPAAAALETGLSSSLSGAPINGGSWKANSAPLEMSQPASVAEAGLGSIGAPEVPEAPPMSPPKPPAPAPTNVLNMGHWESGEGDDSQNLDFGFGSFGPDSDAPEEPTNNGASMSAKEPNSTPARPPPGLSIGGMPPMPANAVLVHELENKLEGTTLGKSVEESQQGGPKPMTSNLHNQPPLPGHPEPGMAPTIPPGGMSQTYNTGYGMGMYNYNTAGNGFMGAPPGPTVGVPHQQKPQTGIPGQQSTGGAPQHLPQQLQQGGLYGTAPSGASSGDNANAPSSNDNSTTGIPPGMPNAMPYNPALFYGQQPYQMGQPHGQVGYGYGYGSQFGNPGFYQQQVMGQSGGYPSYDDQPQQGRGDYNPSKSSNRGYRNNGNQYQNQFNPQQHGGYGGQPYNMGYNVDHFNQRGGYGPPDPYGMQQGSGYSGSGMSSFQDDDRHKGKKGGRNNGFQPQQQHPQQLGGGHQQQPQQQQQQPFLGGGPAGGADTSSSSNNGAGGGWSNNQGGGWGGPSWQGGN